MKASFNGLNLLYGNNTTEKLSKLNVTIIGIGGVGSWIAESLARSGAGEITLVDLDDICASNINRQIHATYSTLGQFKIEVMEKRLKDINPKIKVNLIQSFISEKNHHEIMALPHHYIIDASDDFSQKVAMAVSAHKKKIKLLIIGAAGGKKSPAHIKQADLTEAYNDKLLARLRKELRQKHHLPRKGKFHLPCIFSSERAVKPSDELIRGHKSCDNVLGAVSYVTGTFGFFATQYIIADYLDHYESFYQ